jgi:integrase
MRKFNQLSPLKIAQLKAPGKYHDGLGLYLHVSPSGNKSWAFRYMIGGRAREKGLGPLHTVSLAEARTRAEMARKVILDGRDPIEAEQEERAARKAEQLNTVTFRQAVSEFLRTSKIESFTNDKHRKQWGSTLRNVFPVLGDLPLNSIGPGLVLQAIRPIWDKTPETASRLRGRIERVFDWAKPIGYFTGDNPAQWDLLKDHLPARQKANHHKALPYADLPAFMAKLAIRDSLPARCLEFTILTAVRTQEAIGAKWSEIKSGVWVIPAARMKAKRDHRVPLCKRSLTILKALPRSSEYVFANRRGKPLSNEAMAELLKGMDGNGYTVHGFRSTFSDWARDKTNHPRDVIELALAHQIQDKSEAAYRRGDALDKRRPLMAEWEKFVSTRA